MKEIKFRGVTPKGVTVYGDLTHSNGDIFIDDYKVQPDSVCQLCGYDHDENEVYEGDVVVSYGKEHTVHLVPKYGIFNNLKAVLKKR